MKICCSLELSFIAKELYKKWYFDKNYEPWKIEEWYRWQISDGKHWPLNENTSLEKLVFICGGRIVGGGTKDKLLWVANKNIYWKCYLTCHFCCMKILNWHKLILYLITYWYSSTLNYINYHTQRITENNKIPIKFQQFEIDFECISEIQLIWDSSVYNFKENLNNGKQFI